MITEQQTSIERAASILAETSKQLDKVDAMTANPGKDSWPARFRLLSLPRTNTQEVADFVRVAKKG